MHMELLTRKLMDAAIILAVSAAIAFVIIATSNSLVARASLWKSYSMWASFVTRPDIVATSILAVIVTMGVSTYQLGRGKR